MAKRGGGEAAMQMAPFKRPRNNMAVVQQINRGQQVVVAGPRRTSSLQSPTMLLTGHESEIFTAKFSPEGDYIASAGFDRSIFFWTVFGDCQNLGVLQGHTGAILELHWSPDGHTLYTASTDNTVGVWDVMHGVRIKRIKGHSSFVNSCHPARKGPPLVCSGSDDGTIKIWDTRQKAVVKTLNDGYQVLAVTFNDQADQICSGGIDNYVKIWDLRAEKLLQKMAGHTDTVTGISLSPDGNFVLTNSMDHTAKAWDIRSFAPANRCMGVFHGHQHTLEHNLLKACWSPDGRFVSCGSGDRNVFVWRVGTGELLYKLPGHEGCVNETNFHPKQPILMSCGSDRRIFLGEIEL